MQVREQVIDLLLREHISEALHLTAAEPNDLRSPVVVCRHTAHLQILSRENTLQRRTLSLAGGVSRVATVAILIVHVPSGGLLRSQTQFSITFPAFHLARCCE